MKAWLEISGGALAAWLIVQATGGIESPLLFLYLIAVMCITVRHGRAKGIVSTVGLLSLHLSIIGLSYRTQEHNGVSSDILGDFIEKSFIQAVGLLSGMFLIAVLTSYLLSRLHVNQRLLAASERSLKELSNKQKALLDGMSDGVVSIDVHGFLIGMNRAAAEILGVREEDFSGVSVQEVLKRKAPDLKVLSQMHAPKEVKFRRSANETIQLSYYSRPFGADEGGVLLIVQDVTKLRQFEDEFAFKEKVHDLLTANLDSTDVAPTSEFVGMTPILKKVYSLIERVAPSEVTVLVHGESGTGKELVARAIHQRSTRSLKVFIPVNCSAIPEALLESEFFGHKKGSFTSAHADHLGLFRRAEGGTLFLDEIGELPLSMQAKLLRVLQDKKVRPVGGDSDIPINVRIVAATNRNLKDEVTKGAFREDLYFRLNVINIVLPPLRDRKDDIPLLVDAFLKKKASGLEPVEISLPAMRALMDYDYPGNVRELENIMERAIVLGGAIILPEHLPESVHEASSYGDRAGKAISGPVPTRVIEDDSISFPVSLDSLLENVERRYLLLALSQSNGTRKKAAELLGINFRSLRYRLQKFGLATDDES